tara:strand:+ start:106 stop:1263 length:1158 start_codon:yes stop_codon:yes gene_type:complete
MVTYLTILINTIVFAHANIINEIDIIGNIKTPDQLILRNINHTIYSQYNKDLVNYDIDNLYNMGIFDSIAITLDKNIYKINVKEKKLITYAPLIRKEEGIGWSAGPIININNINGSAKNIYFSSSFGAIKSGEIKYFNQKLLLEYKYNTYNSIESNYTINTNNLFISYIIQKRKYEINITPQLNKYSLKYNNPKQTKNYKYFSLSYKFLYKISDSSKYNIKYTYNRSLNEQTDYATLFIHYNYQNQKTFPWIITNSKIILNSHSNSPDFENLYIGGENFVKGFYPNPSENPDTSRHNLIFKNLIFNSLQFEFPIKIIQNKFVKTNLLLFYDYGLGSNIYSNFDKNKLIGYGFGLSMITADKMKFDICIGFNDFGTRTIHFISNIN